MKHPLLILTLLSGCAGLEAGEHEFLSLQAAAKSVCEVVADSNSYAGRRIITKGLLARGPHRQLLHDRNCPQWDFSVRHSLQADGDPAAERLVRRRFRKDPAGSIPVVYSGMLVVRDIISDCDRPSCHEYVLQDARLLATTPKATVAREEDRE